MTGVFFDPNSVTGGGPTSEVEYLQLKIKELEANCKVLAQARDGLEAKLQENERRSKSLYDCLRKEAGDQTTRAERAEVNLGHAEARIKDLQTALESARRGMRDRDSAIEEMQEFLPSSNQYGFAIRIPAEHNTERLRLIIEAILIPMVKSFAAKSASYETSRGNIADNFGTAGQYMKMYDKIHKLERPLFEDRGRGEELEFEPVLEVLSDLFGHVMLAAIKYLEVRDGMEEEVDESFQD